MDYLDYDHEQRLFLKNLKYLNLKGTRLSETRKSDKQDSVHSAFKRSTTTMPRTRTRFRPQSNWPYSDLFLRPEFRRMWKVIHPTNCWPPQRLCSWFSGYKPLCPCCLSPDWTLQKAWFWFAFWSAKVHLIWYYHLTLVEKSPRAKKTPANRGHFIKRGCYLTKKITL